MARTKASNNVRASAFRKRGPSIKEHKAHPKNAVRDHLIAAASEFVGTILFLFFAFAWHQTVALQSSPAVAPNGQTTAESVIFISIGYGFSLLVCAWTFYRISGGLFNPAVLLCMTLTGSLPPIRSLCLFPAEIAGSLVAASLVDCMFPGDIGVVNTTLSKDTSVAQGVFIEMMLTSLLLLAILMLAAEKTKVTFMAPLGIGLALFVAELAGVFYTGGSLNPARSFGPAVVSRTFPKYHWIYWVGPGMGSLLAAGYYRINKYFDYEEANPGQDSAGGDFTGHSGDGGRV